MGAGPHDNFKRNKECGAISGYRTSHKGAWQTAKIEIVEFIQSSIFFSTRHLHSGLVPQMRIETNKALPWRTEVAQGTGRSGSVHDSAGATPYLNKEMHVIKEIAKSELSEAQSCLIEMFQRLNFGRVEGLVVKRGQPVFEPAPRLVQKLLIGSDNGPRPESKLRDFILKQQTVEVLEVIGRIDDGRVHSIEVRNGLPVSMEVEHCGVRRG